MPRGRAPKPPRKQASQPRGAAPQANAPHANPNPQFAAPQVKGVERSTFLIDASGMLVAEWRGIKMAGHVVPADWRRTNKKRPQAPH